MSMRVVVVTGASRGLGRAIALAFAARGDFVYIGYGARGDEAEETLRRAREAGGEGAILHADARDRAAVEAAMDRVVRERGGLDVLVNNAGVAHDEPFAMMSEESWEEVMAVNLDGVFRFCRAAVRPMLAKKRGAIVNVASIAAIRARPGQASYAASKGGVIALTATLGAELAPRGVRVNAVVPGMIAAGMAARLDRRIASTAREHIPLGRFGDAAEVAKAVIFLASDDASYIVGQALVVDGGFSL
jgi:3-oxoacyl-[acyl-carrier protein] reductase